MTGRWLALMPLRSGSRGIPGKNVRAMAGRPLFAWALEQTVNSGCFDAVWVATDSEEIGGRVRELFGSTVTVVGRSAEGASDEAATERVMLEVAKQSEFDVMGLIQATSPLTQAADLVAARQRFETETLDSLLTAVPSRRFYWSDAGAPHNYDPSARPRRQEMPPTFVENGAFYLTRRALLLAESCRLGGRVGVHSMAEETLHEVDDLDDWAVVEGLLRRRLARERLSGIRALVVDVDGTLTDGGMYYSAQGESLKRFDTRDAKGLALLRDAGVRVCVVSAECSPSVAARMSKLGIDDYHPGTSDKWRLLREKLCGWGMRPDEVAVIGDDVGDTELMTHLGFAFCPADSVASVRAIADRVCTSGGGRGAVREACDLLLAARVQDHASRIDE